MQKLRVVSADSHMTEPAKLWEERLDKKWRDRAPRVVTTAETPRPMFVAEGLKPFPVALGFAAGRSGEELKQHAAKGYEAARPSGWDPIERIKDQEIDGVEAEVLYTTLGMPLFGLVDGGLQRACFSVYNDWVSEFCSHNPTRLYGIGLVSLEDIDAGVKELERIHRKGLRGAMIWGSPPSDKPYSSRVYDPFWQAASELQMPLSLHVITGKGKESELNFEQIGLFYMCLIHEVQRSLSSMIFGGVLERFPKLLLVSAENDTGWIPHFMYRMDHGHDKFGAMEKEPLPMKPSEYVRRQMWATFQDDPVGPATYKMFGEDKYMWASDFPHSDSTWPDSRQWIQKDFDGVPLEVTKKIVFDNAVKLYRMDLH